MRTVLLTVRDNQGENYIAGANTILYESGACRKLPCPARGILINIVHHFKGKYVCISMSCIFMTANMTLRVHLTDLIDC